MTGAGEYAKKSEGHRRHMNIQRAKELFISEKIQTRSEPVKLRKTNSI
jgi:hypothetical protein